MKEVRDRWKMDESERGKGWDMSDIEREGEKWIRVGKQVGR